MEMKTGKWNTALASRFREALKSFSRDYLISIAIKFAQREQINEKIEAPPYSSISGSPLLREAGFVPTGFSNYGLKEANGYLSLSYRQVKAPVFQANVSKSSRPNH